MEGGRAGLLPFFFLAISSEQGASASLPPLQPPGRQRSPGSAPRRARAPQVLAPLKPPLPKTGFRAEIHVAKKVPICFDYFLTTLLVFAFGLASTQMGNFGAICVHKLVLKAQRSASSGT